MFLEVTNQNPPWVHVILPPLVKCSSTQTQYLLWAQSNWRR
uniref:Uncharacterized protein n=1 Tax=Anguilla anguilla TaxID=7936 RepID=A0A0E9UCK5_ANGAN